MPLLRNRESGCNSPTFVGLLLLSVFSVDTLLMAADLEEARWMLASGRYEDCLELTSSAIEEGAYGEAWYLLQAEAQFQLGQYADAHASIQTGLEKYTWSIRLRWLGHQVAPFDGQVDQARIYYDDISRLAGAYPWRFTDADNLLVLGQLALSLGGDAREVQEAFFLRARRNNPNHRGPRLALGRLALDKHDDSLAADIFRESLEIHPQDPDLHYGMGRALLRTKPAEAAEHFARALEINPRHAPTLLLRADREIDGEDYLAAEQTLQTVLDTSPAHPEALALLSVISRIRNEDETAREFRSLALQFWNENPLVDHLIGRKLSQKYRFSEGAEHQRQALRFDPDYLPAHKQLAEDLLRLGQEEEGWQLVESAFASDAYDVLLYNMLQLRDDLERFATIESEHFSIRMEAREARIYGADVLALLEEARQTLGAKYGWEPEVPIIVEIFPDADDFAVRTFGLPGAGGYLGVCFGRVITAQSPATLTMQGTNWQSVLWHEYAHVVTLNLTQHRMPRWLSEGISVHEERARDPGCGERMNQQYRELILGGGLTPIGELSQAFLRPLSPVHIQFAYFESSLVVDFILDHYGAEALRLILEDLGQGLFINDSLERRLGPLEFVEGEFRDYVLAHAFSFAPLVDWSSPPLPADAPVEDWLDWQRTHPFNLSGALRTADLLIQQEKLAEAAEVLERIIPVSQDIRGRQSPTLKLSQVYRLLGDTDREYNLLTEYAALDGSALAVYRRLAEIDLEREAWSAVHHHARRALAVNPLDPANHRWAARSAEETGLWSAAGASYRALIELDPTDPAEWHYRFACVLWQQGEHGAARRQVLQSLELAPRFREAQRLLLTIREAETQPAELPRELVPPPPPTPDITHLPSHQ